MTNFKNFFFYFMIFPFKTEIFNLTFHNSRLIWRTCRVSDPGWEWPIPGPNPNIKIQSIFFFSLFFIRNYFPSHFLMVLNHDFVPWIRILLLKLEPDPEKFKNRIRIRIPAKSPGPTGSEALRRRNERSWAFHAMCFARHNKGTPCIYLLDVLRL